MLSPRILIITISFSLITSCSGFFQLIKYSPSSKLSEVTYAEAEVNRMFKFVYPDTTNNLYLRKLRTDFGLDSLIAGKSSEFEKVKTILNWTHFQWKHDGNNNPQKSDPISILEEARTGKNFRCVEYGIVSASALNSLGFKARVLGLKTRDVEKVKYGAGHVVAEVFINELDKWVFIDGQMNLIPVLAGKPLNASEFRNAIKNNRKELKLVNLNSEANEKQKETYLNWIAKYLFYLDATFDQRMGENVQAFKVNNMTKLTLVPVDAKNPEIFQRKWPINYSEYTHNINDFYQKP